MNSDATIFLVEDDAQLRRSLEWLLLSHGYQVVATSTILEALDTYDPTLPGCLVFDVQLPEGTGLDLLEKFRKRGGTHPFIVMTAYGRVPIAVEAMRLGAIDFFEKPFEHSQLLKRVTEAVERDCKSRQLDEDTHELYQRLRVLAPREWEVAKLVAAGHSSKEIAKALGIKPKTVEVHRHNILTKLKADSSAEVVALVTKAQALAQLGLFEPPN